MFVFAFFTVVFSSVFLFIYAVMFVKSHLSDLGFAGQTPEDLLINTAVVLLPILVMWMVFGYINQYVVNRGMNKKQTELLRQLQKNQDYTDLVVRVMLDAEHEIKDGFVLNKFDVFITDMNEALGEIIQRCNIASSAQLEQLWLRVRRGERWTLGKAILDASKNQSTFDAWVSEKVSRDKVFRGSLLEFCSRYQNLLQLLEKHDRDRVFLRMIEAGVFGKVYSIIAPLSEGLQQTPQREVKEPASQQDYASVLKIATIEEPRADETIVNVDKTEDDDNQVEAPRRSFLSRLNPFRRRQEEFETDDEPDDPFFQALQSSFQSNGQPPMREVSFSDAQPEPDPEVQEEVAESNYSVDFGSTRSTLDSLRSANSTYSDLSATREKISPSFESHSYAGTEAERYEPSLQTQPAQATEAVADKQDDEDLVYPFGGWTDEKNYHQ
ncbi:MAG: hypothetical protein J6Y91_03250 [Alphaproteobacteria bacterium]|nr:hypothetical protein [Alphaproteobacteria bacterium]